jgi:hypothetical protein
MRNDVAARPTSAPWFLYSVLLASTSVIVGVIWDISWHQTIGRDTFWTPAHLAIYLGGVVAGAACGLRTLHTTLAGSPADRAAAVRVWGFSGPLGAWVCIWGAFAMLTSAPFDDWWHNAYGLDVKILSPPHALLAAGICAIQYGAMLSALAWRNRSSTDRGPLHALYLFSAGLLLINSATIGSEYLQRWDMHRPLFYQVAAGVFPFALVSSARAGGGRWPATTIAIVYTAITLIMIVVLPLFPGRPLLGPIYVHTDRFLPPAFPLLLIVPALALDLTMRRVGPGRDWGLAAVIALVFVVTFVGVQWPFADFLTTPWARNWFFVADRMPYGVPPAIQQRWYVLEQPDGTAWGLPLAVLLAFVSTRCGLWGGNWLSRVQR